MDENKMDLEQILEMEAFEQLDEPFRTDQYGLDVECETYRERDLWEVDQAIDAIREESKLEKADEATIRELVDDVEIIELDRVPKYFCHSSRSE